MLLPLVVALSRELTVELAEEAAVCCGLAALGGGGGGTLAALPLESLVFEDVESFLLNYAQGRYKEKRSR